MGIILKGVIPNPGFEPGEGSCAGRLRMGPERSSPAPDPSSSLKALLRMTPL